MLALEEMGDHVPDCGLETIKALECFFTADDNKDIWNFTSDTVIDQVNGMCAADQGHLRSFTLTKDEQTQFRESTSKLWERRHQNAFLDFEKWVMKIINSQVRLTL